MAHCAETAAQRGPRRRNRRERCSALATPFGKKNRFRGAKTLLRLHQHSGRKVGRCHMTGPPSGLKGRFGGDPGAGGNVQHMLTRADTGSPKEGGDELPRDTAESSIIGFRAGASNRSPMGTSVLRDAIGNSRLLRCISRGLIADRNKLTGSCDCCLGDGGLQQPLPKIMAAVRAAMVESPVSIRRNAATAAVLLPSSFTGNPQSCFAKWRGIKCHSLRPSGKDRKCKVWTVPRFVILMNHLGEIQVISSWLTPETFENCVRRYKERGSRFRG